MNKSNSGSRLKAAVHASGLTPSKFASDFGISNQTLNNWFVRGLPGRQLLSVCKYLGMNPEWMESGAGEPYVSQIDEDYRQLSEEEKAESDRIYLEWAQRPNAKPNSLPSTAPPRLFEYYEISWARAGEGVKGLDITAFSKNPRHSSEVFVGPTAFWLTVSGNSMVGDGSASFPSGYLILVAPDVEPRPGQFVVARLTQTNEGTFKQMVWDAGDFYLKPLNAAYPIKLMDGNWEIIGTVVDGKIPRSVFE